MMLMQMFVNYCGSGITLVFMKSVVGVVESMFFYVLIRRMNDGLLHELNF